MIIQKIALVLWIFHKTLSQDVQKTCSKKPGPDAKCRMMCLYYQKNLIDETISFKILSFRPVFRQSVSYCDEKLESEDNCERVTEMNNCVIKDHQSKFEGCASQTKFSLEQLKPLQVIRQNVSDDKACYQRCVYRQFKIIDYKDEINTEVLQMFVKKGLKVDKMSKMCKTMNANGDKCISITRTLQCIHKSLDLSVNNDVLKDCVKKLNMTTDDNGLPMISDPKFECMLHCKYVKYLMIDDKGKMIPYNFNRYFVPAVEICETRFMSETNVCKRTNKVGKCVFLEAMQLRNKCSAETKVEKNIHGTFPAKINPAHACYFVCLYKYYHFLNKNDEIDVTGIASYLGVPKDAPKVIEDCTNKNKHIKEKCLRLVHILYCINLGSFRQRFTA